MAAEELGGGVDDDVGTVFDGPDEVRGAEGVVDDERDAVRMGQLRERLDVRDVGVRVAEGLDEDRFRIVLDGGLHFVEVMPKIFQKVVGVYNLLKKNKHQYYLFFYRIFFLNFRL